MTDFDPAKLGLESHYDQKQQDAIRRLILEDWKASDVKLPTYMKLVARYIMPDHLPEEWIKKLSHQTMSKLLKGVSTPRYEFWACLHLYLMKKYGDLGITQPGATDLVVLGKALVRFADIQAAADPDGEFWLENQTAVKIESAEQFQRLFVLKRMDGVEEFTEPVYISYEGSGVTRDEKMVAVLRNLATHEIKTVEASPGMLRRLDDADLLARLDGLVDKS